MPYSPKNKKIAVLGAGRSGIAAAKLAAKGGASVLLSESGMAEDFSGITGELNSLGINTEFSQHSSKVLKSDIIILSPGIPATIHTVVEAEKMGIPVISEIEFSSLFIEGPIIAITGSNGKSTTTALIGELLEGNERKCHVAGNIGTAVSDIVINEENRKDIFVIEVSSFQLETIDTFHPRVAILLNLSPDHLDRYPDVASYYSAKKNIFRNLREDDFIIANADDPEVLKMVSSFSADIKYFSLRDTTRDAYVKNELICFPGSEFEINKIRLQGAHNYQNVMAALLAIQALFGDSSKDRISNVLLQFKGLAHRLEKVGEVDGVSFINDSKATTIESLQVALQSFKKKVVLIAGGKNKGGDFTRLNELVKTNTIAVVALGDAGKEIYEAWGQIVKVWQTRDFGKAITKAYQWAKESNGDVLLSPACASFDMFRDYVDRGNRFKSIVGNL